MTLITVTVAAGLLTLARTQVTTTQPSTEVTIKLIGSSQFIPATTATIYSAPWCGPCQGYEKAILTEMPKEGWIVRHTGDKDVAGAHIAFDQREDAGHARGPQHHVLSHDDHSEERQRGRSIRRPRLTDAVGGSDQSDREAEAMTEFFGEWIPIALLVIGLGLLGSALVDIAIERIESTTTNVQDL